MKRIRILHTADLHLDASFAALGVNGRVGNRLREAQRQAFSNIIGHARDWPADMLLIAGDLFDSAMVRDDTVAFVLESFEHLSPIQVYIAPGNRDPYADDSPYALELWPDNVTIFTPGEWQQHSHPSQPIAIHGIGCDGKDDSGTWFSGLRVPDDGNLHIALAHGTETAHQPAHGKRFAPFDAAAVAQEGLAYLALGHFHDAVEVKGDFPTVMRYPGTPQGRNFLETGPRRFTEVVIECNDTPPASVRVTQAVCNDISFETCSIAADKNVGAAVARVLEQVQSEPSRCVLQLRLTGAVAPPLYDYIASLHTALREHFFHVVIEETAETAAFPGTYPGQHTCLSKVVAALAARIADAPDTETALFEAYTRDLTLKACLGHALPEYATTDVLS